MSWRVLDTFSFLLVAQKSAGICFPLCSSKELKLFSPTWPTPLQLPEARLSIIHLLGVGLGLMGQVSQTLIENVPARVISSAGTDGKKGVGYPGETKNYPEDQISFLPARLSCKLKLFGRSQCLVWTGMLPLRRCHK